MLTLIMLLTKHILSPIQHRNILKHSAMVMWLNIWYLDTSILHYSKLPSLYYFRNSCKTWQGRWLNIRARNPCKCKGSSELHLLLALEEVDKQDPQSKMAHQISHIEEQWV